jgi:low temperature requirement protein LtrA
LITIELWWIYFDRFAAAAEEHLRGHDAPVLAASDAYSYLHLVLVAGIIVFAVGMRFATRSVGHSLSEAARLALCGGVATYLVGHAAFRLRLVGSVAYEKLVAAVALIVVFALGSGLRAWAVVLLVTIVVGLLCVRETLLGRTPRREQRASSLEHSTP